MTIAICLLIRERREKKVQNILFFLSVSPHSLLIAGLLTLAFFPPPSQPPVLPQHISFSGAQTRKPSNAVSLGS